MDRPQELREQIAKLVDEYASIKYEPKAFMASLQTYSARYNLDINFIDQANAGRWIYSTCYYWAREYLTRKAAA